MEFKKYLLLVITIFYFFISWGQTTPLIKTKEGGLIICNNFKNLGINFYVDYKKGKIKRNEPPSTMFSEDIFEIGDNLLLSFYATDIYRFHEKDNLAILEKNAKTEIDTLESNFKTDLKIKTNIIKLKNNTDCIFWHYKMPDSISDHQEIFQYTISFIQKYLIIEVNITQYYDIDKSSYNEILNLIKDIGENTFFTDEDITLEYLCSKRK